MSKMSQLFLGKEVQIYPGDSRKKFGTVLEITDKGVIFQITMSDPDSTYVKGDIHFIAYSANLSFRIKQNG